MVCSASVWCKILLWSATAFATFAAAIVCSFFKLASMPKTSVMPPKLADMLFRLALRICVSAGKALAYALTSAWPSSRRVHSVMPSFATSAPRPSDIR